MKSSVTMRRKMNSLARRLGWSYAPARPTRAWISPTTRCNLACRTCGRSMGPFPIKDMSEEVYEVLRREIIPYLGEVTLTGMGEPFMAPLLPTMLEDCERHGVRVTLTTNGTVWDEPSVRRLARTGGRVVVSVDGADAETMQAVRRGLKFERFQENLDRFGDVKKREGGSGFELFFNVVILRMNLDQLDAIVDWAARLGVDCVYFSNFGATGHDDAFAEESLERHPELVNPVLDEVGAKCERLGIDYIRPQFLSGAEGETKKGEQGRLLQCPLPWWGDYIESDGSVFPCCQWWPPVANIGDGSFAGIWNGKGFRNIRREVNQLPLPGPCRRCVLGERAF